MAALGKSVEYALHCLVYLADGRSAGGRTEKTLASLAEFQGVSESYLAKVFTRLTKAGLVRSSVGVGGGFELARNPEDISFWDVVMAVEGGLRLFECREVRAGCVLYQGSEDKPEWLVGGTCEIHGVMMEAQAQYEAVLKGRSLGWLARVLGEKVPPSDRKAAEFWFARRNAGKT